MPASIHVDPCDGEALGLKQHECTDRQKNYKFKVVTFVFYLTKPFNSHISYMLSFLLTQKSINAVTNICQSQLKIPELLCDTEIVFLP